MRTNTKIQCNTHTHTHWLLTATREFVKHKPVSEREQRAHSTLAYPKTERSTNRELNESLISAGRILQYSSTGDFDTFLLGSLSTQHRASELQFPTNLSQVFLVFFLILAWYLCSCVRAFIKDIQEYSPYMFIAHRKREPGERERN